MLPPFTGPRPLQGPLGRIHITPIPGPVALAQAFAHRPPGREVRLARNVLYEKDPARRTCCTSLASRRAHQAAARDFIKRVLRTEVHQLRNQITGVHSTHDAILQSQADADQCAAAVAGTQGPVTVRAVQQLAALQLAILRLRALHTRDASVTHGEARLAFFEIVWHFRNRQAGPFAVRGTLPGADVEAVIDERIRTLRPPRHAWQA